MRPSIRPDTVCKFGSSHRFPLNLLDDLRFHAERVARLISKVQDIDLS